MFVIYFFYSSELPKKKSAHKGWTESKYLAIWKV